MILFYDWEVFKYDNLVVIIVPDEKKEYIFVNDLPGFRKFYESHKNYIWCGYNSRHYDQYITKAAILDFNLKEVNDHIIVKKQDGYSFSRLFNKVHLITYDVMPNPPVGLKTMEGFMGHDIKESDVPFDIDRPLTEAEMQKTIKYCRHDVGETVEVFLHRKADFDSHLSLIQTFELPLSNIAKTQAQLSAAVLECRAEHREDEWELFTVPTLRLKKYAFVRDWFMNPENYRYKRDNGKKVELVTEVCGVPHVFGWGGLHGAKEKYFGEGLIIHVDVNSYYPSLMIVYNLLTRNSKHPEKYKQIYDYRLQLKREGKKAEQAPYKIVLNSTYGISNDKFSQAFDPRNSHLICMNGQLLLLDLLEKLEEIPGFELIQSNTDGLIIKVPDTDWHFEQVDDICFEWEHRTGMGLGFDYLTKIYQKDVNNYLWLEGEEVGEKKGAYVKDLSPIDYDLPIVNKALVNYMGYGVPVEKTIGDCDELIEFQKIVKLSAKYDFVQHNGKKYLYKCYRVFASKRENDGKIFKCRAGSNPAKFGSTPDRCFINNDNIVGAKVPDYLDKQFYIDLAKERLRQYGVEAA